MLVTVTIILRCCAYRFKGAPDYEIFLHTFPWNSQKISIKESRIGSIFLTKNEDKTYCFVPLFAVRTPILLVNKQGLIL